MEIYLSNEELAEIGYYKDGLIWIIAGNRYRLKEATPKGYIFIKLK